jgi:hypothetical protein
MSQKAPDETCGAFNVLKMLFKGLVCLSFEAGLAASIIAIAAKQ